jgi:hypothetical protein
VTGKVTAGRRVASVADLERPGDYCGPITGFTGDTPAVFFLKPNARDPDAPAAARSIQHVDSPPHSFRECGDGSLEVRPSIGNLVAAVVVKPRQYWAILIALGLVLVTLTGVVKG